MQKFAYVQFLLYLCGRFGNCSMMSVMKKFIILLIAGALLTACRSTEERLRTRAGELCQYIPDHELLDASRDYMTPDFYAVLDTLFHLPSLEAMDHEWLYYFVTGNGGTIADYEVVSVSVLDAAHAEALIRVRQKWEDGSFDESSDVEDHVLSMERVKGEWLMSDFDGHKADCIRHIAIHRREEALRAAISDYLVREIGSQYLQGELCVPALLIVREEEGQVWGDFWVWWYEHSGDSLRIVSGGNHPGKMTWTDEQGTIRITSFEQVEDGARNLPSAKRIFGDYYDIYENMHSNEAVREAVRIEQLNNWNAAQSKP